ncbi:DUF1934 domain-containing protein [Salipaludibacillus sp. CUR1]|uniref:DUF1934 domain-containing protein n=1 Tax=Salipaludibacillus sp. CUR1 TaxID=2820003 RepID=UPI001E520C1A|nr:DUF1934 domain-containing protein [Salipaludibacillus sp. CUR1]MCE7792427.1 DUF1934 domain-containing protein [Salipaludibacillus sp. CUR1]
MSSSGLPVTIHMRTTIKDGRRKEVHSMEASGELFHRGGMTVIRFSEPKEENDTQSTIQTVKLHRGQMSVQRKGAITMNQRFIPGRETEGMYHSPYGPMDMRTDTSEVDYEWDSQALEGFIDLRYALVMQGSKTGNYHMHVKIKEV